MLLEYATVFLVILVISFYCFETWNRKKTTQNRPPPSLPSLPIVGSLPFLRNLSNISVFLLEKSKELGPIFTFRTGNKLVLALNDLDVIEEALVGNSSSFSSRPDMYINKIVNPENKGMVSMDTNAQLKRVRKHFMSIMREFGVGVRNLIEKRVLKETQAMTNFVLAKNGEPFDPKELTVQVSSNVTLSILFGWRQDYSLGIPELIHQIDRYIQNFDIVFDVVPVLRFIPPFSNKITTVKESNKRIYTILDQEIRKCLEKQESCLVKRFIEKEGSDWDIEQIIFMLRDVISGGTDTIAATFRWSLVALANNPQIQKRLQDDIDSVIARDELPSLTHQSRLPYVEATILEIYRWRTMVPLSVLRACSAESVLRGYTIPAGTLVLPNLYAVHNNTVDWMDPDRFQPERFLNKDDEIINRDRVLPFATGRRSCPGEILARAEIFLILTSLLQRFTILLPKGVGKLCDDPALPVSITLEPKTFSVRLIDRFNQTVY